MAKVIVKTSRDGGGLFHALAIGLGMEILAGTLDAQKDSPAYTQLLDIFAQRYPKFIPKTWDNLKSWLAFYNDSRDMELLLAPVLLQLNHHYPTNLDEQILKELNLLVLENKDKIRSGSPWHELTILDQKTKSLVPKLDGLELVQRSNILITLQRALLRYLEQFLATLLPEFFDLTADEKVKAKEQHKKELDQHLAGLTSEEIYTIFATDFSDLRASIKPHFHTAKKAHQQVYCFDDLSGMVAALKLNLVEVAPGFGTDLKLGSRTEPSLSEKTTISLQYDNQSWHVATDEMNLDFINRVDRKLKMSVNQGFQAKIEIAAPTESELEAIAGTKINIRSKIVDNPGGGDCAFYAFAIALINIIKEENVYKNKKMFERWVALDPSIAEHFGAICSFNFNRPNNELLYQLQRSLRTITHFSQLNELKRACCDPENYTDPNNPYKIIVGNSTYIKFAEFYYNLQTDARFNELADSDAILRAILRIKRGDVRENFEHLILVPVFLSLIYGGGVAPKSITLDRLPINRAPVVEAMAAITQDAFWGTHLNLDYLARAFEVNFHPLENLVPVQEFKGDVRGRHTVTINNVNNAHWTTEVTYAIELKALIPSLRRVTDGAKLTSGEETVDTSLLFEQSQKGGKGNLKDSRAIKQVRFSLTAEQFELERLAEKKEQEKLEQNAKLLGLEWSETTEKTAAMSESEKRSIEFLRDVATKAAISYINYSNSIWFSLFHRHGNTGRVRAREFLTQFLMIDSFDEAKFFLVSFLSNTNNNGNTYPHSFRTMLLNELLKDPKPTLQYTSEHFDEILDEVSNVLDVNLELLECAM
ncbi:hypothetical protein [Legionella fallonii]|uniref:OTU domain-containing protein n=1 Tax=Legionella fallonii LLAP-10 TaxID=1212491 RepID=A0A098G8X5_9GAMM|nr:hypothetical protein [Legionella fallonii]CEG58449.1 conserved protein of unknown function [Legionella fallonii LLAP-10]